MKFITALVGLFLIVWPVFCQEKKIIYTVPYGQGANDIHFSSSMAMGDSPTDWAPIDGARMWLSQNKNALVTDINSGKQLFAVTYPENWARYMDASFVFGDGWAVANRGNPVVIQFSPDGKTMTDFRNYHAENNSFPLRDSKPYILHDTAFFFLEDGRVMSIPKGKEALSSEATVELLLSWKTKVPDQGTERDELERKLINQGKFLIVDGMIYPSSLANFLDYLISTSLPSDSIQDKRLGSLKKPVLGVDLVGNIVVRNNELIFIFDQHGKLIQLLGDDPPYEKSTAEDLFSSLTVNFNGDLLEMNAVKNDKVYFTKFTRTWGTDIVALAIAGIAATEVAKFTESLHDYNGSELRILRNAFFALQGYDFQSWDLKSYFSGYDWYSAKPGVKAETAALNPDQKRLFDLVLAEEARRK
jgi:hypothetical protein